ncbi:hypothetical protein R1sor_014646 [Riccia sorocarpa]|uniref:Uncharacterized protein n=1 Tax=Riccia sorocarpa TaxID=122646 RepID=A0ABD3HA05_9MARC
MGLRNWRSGLSARVGQRTVTAVQFLIIASLGSIVLLRDSLGFGVDVNLNSSSPLDTGPLDGAGIHDLYGPKRNIASVNEKQARELESIPNPTDIPTDSSNSFEQRSEEKSKKAKGDQVVEAEFKGKKDLPVESIPQDRKKVEDVSLDNDEEEQITQFDKARESRGRPRGKDVSKELREENDIEVKEHEHMFLAVDKPPREFTIPEDLQELQPKETEVVKENAKTSHKKVVHEEVAEEHVKEALQVEKVPTESDNSNEQKLADNPEQLQAEGGGIKAEETDKPENPEPVKPKSPPKPPVFPGEPFSLGKNPKNWDQQRKGWLEKYPWMRTNAEGKPRVLIVTGSAPWPCASPIGDHVQLKSLKNKIDYARQHHHEIFYNIAHLERSMTSFWAKLPIIRKLMLTHPEVEWIFWVDADAVFTDMLFELPLEKYDEYNVIAWGWEQGLYKEKNWLALNDGSFLFRNCQWSLDFLEIWAPMGPEGEIRNKWGEYFSAYMSHRDANFPADDQSAMVHLFLSRTELQSKLRLESDFEMSGYWEDHVNKYEEFMTMPGNHPGLGGKTWPFITHFTGCQPCSGNHNPMYSGEECVRHMERAYNFADNQVLQPMGFMHENLTTFVVKKVKEDSEDYNILESLGPNTWASASESYGL